MFGMPRVSAPVGVGRVAVAGAAAPPVPVVPPDGAPDEDGTAGAAWHETAVPRAAAESASIRRLVTRRSRPDCTDSSIMSSFDAAGSVDLAACAQAGRRGDPSLATENGKSKPSNLRSLTLGLFRRRDGVDLLHHAQRIALNPA